MLGGYVEARIGEAEAAGLKGDGISGGRGLLPERGRECGSDETLGAVGPGHKDTGNGDVGGNLNESLSAACGKPLGEVSGQVDDLYL